ncbi:MAG: hypothetical protein ACPL1A_10090 [Candidatus Kapaibacteriota bacterium]
MKISMFIWLSVVILITGCRTFILSQINNSQNAFESILASTDEIKKLDKLPNISDSLISISLLDSFQLSELINERLSKYNSILIHFWSTLSEGTTQNIDSNLDTLINLFGDERVLLISFDISSQRQIQLIKKFLNSKKIKGKFFIIQTNNTSVLDAINDIQNLTSYKKAILSIDKDPLKNSLSVTYILNKNKQIQYRASNIIDIEKVKLIFTKGE